MARPVKWGGATVIALVAIGAVLGGGAEQEGSAPVAERAAPTATPTPTPRAAVPPERRRTGRARTTATPIATPAPTATAVAPVAPPARPALSSCDANVRVRPATTTCPFAQNVFYAYWRAGAATSRRLTAYSPATGRTYDVRCRGTAMIACTSGDGSYVAFPRAAVMRYDEEQAARYAATHDLGPQAPAAPTPDSDPAPEPGPRCDPGYAGACLNPDATDYDCAGGSGDGPLYTGRVEVVGEDRFDLDRDGDGVACEP